MARPDRTSSETEPTTELCEPGDGPRPGPLALRPRDPGASRGATALEGELVPDVVEFVVAVVDFHGEPFPGLTLRVFAHSRGEAETLAACVLGFGFNARAFHPDVWREQLKRQGKGA